MLAHDLYARLLATEQHLEARRSSPHQAHAARFGSKAPRPPMPGASLSTPRPGTPPPKPYYTPRPASGASPVSGADYRPDGHAAGRTDGRCPASVCQLLLNMVMLFPVASNGSRKTFWVCTMMVVFSTVSYLWRIMCMDQRDTHRPFLLILPGTWILVLQITFLRRWRSCT
jgi:hypothetical protein